ncbi:TIGR04283 family arsenosugar biosynthesis glycosyltransferase [Aurantibacter aestuarii]|uniref:Glycosyl transferase family 2 n=1 Tax=Aurantibacter aestuarii TaxID=1266046 RepID=A0A2T1NE20_9FLAO|nr:TIGR04283 family arsenosugar biosynthesis glycosyltransferase [Aurantibacter aestuarii]PSG90693.1 glycosyl transferase family 2 [Aurantibacter aestuarii]
MISIIIPVLNEAETIEELLHHLIDNASLENITEIIVVDGGSTDGTQDLVINLGLNVRLISSQKGRAKQMNTGAKASKGTILYFLHADSFPPNRYDAFIIQEYHKNNLAGCFRLRFDNDHWWLRLASWLTQFSWRACRGGDQSQFITKDLFNDIGGFDESYIIYEDNILINELFARKEFVVINKEIRTSARLYERHGVWKLQYHFWTIYVKKWFGASADDLLSYYKKHIA